MIKLKHTILFICIFINTVAAQQFLEEQFQFSEKLFAENKYFESITELKRLQYYDTLNSYRFITHYLIAKCYKGGAKYNDAIKYFRFALRLANNTNEIYELKSEIIRCNILRGTTEESFIQLDELEAGYNNKIKEINYWRGWAYIFEDKWGEAAKYFGKIEIAHPLKKFADSVENEKYSILFPKLISYILPGIGQFYTGNYLSGLMSFGWNALLLYLSVQSFNAARIFDGFITTALFFRFHRGNVQNAEKFAVEKNLEITNKALSYLQNYYQGLKP